MEIIKLLQIKDKVLTAMCVRSVMFTGAPAVGKTTQQRLLTDDIGRHRLGLDYATREPRSNEVNGVHRHFVSKEEFLERFQAGEFLEPDLEFAEYDKNYYGTPKSWINLIVEKSTPLVVVPVSVQIVKDVKAKTGPELLWVHLYSSKEVRKARLSERGLRGDSLQYRLSSDNGDSFGKVYEADMVLDTSCASKYNTLEAVAENL